MLKRMFHLFKRSTAEIDVPGKDSLDLEKILKELENKEEMIMLIKDFYARGKMDKGGGSSSSPISSS